MQLRHNTGSIYNTETRLPVFSPAIPASSNLMILRSLTLNGSTAQITRSLSGLKQGDK